MIKISEESKHSLDLYNSEGLHPGSFLKAVVDNDLLEAMKHADERSLVELQAIVRYVYTHFSYCFTDDGRAYFKPKGK